MYASYALFHWPIRVDMCKFQELQSLAINAYLTLLPSLEDRIYILQLVASNLRVPTRCRWLQYYGRIFGVL